MSREAYWIEKALHRAKITPDRGGEILFHAFQNLKEEALRDAEVASAGIALERETFRAALEDIAANTQCAVSRQVAVEVLHPPVRETNTEAPSAEVIPFGKENA